MRVLFANELAVVGGGYSEGDDFDPMGGGMGSYGSGGVSDYGIGIWDDVKSAVKGVLSALGSAIATGTASTGGCNISYGSQTVGGASGTTTIQLSCVTPSAAVAGTATIGNPSGGR